MYHSVDDGRLRRGYLDRTSWVSPLLTSSIGFSCIDMLSYCHSSSAHHGQAPTELCLLHHCQLMQIPKSHYFWHERSVSFVQWNSRWVWNWIIVRIRPGYIIAIRWLFIWHNIFRCTQKFVFFNCKATCVKNFRWLHSLNYYAISIMLKLFQLSVLVSCPFEFGRSWKKQDVCCSTKDPKCFRSGRFPVSRSRGVSPVVECSTLLRTFATFFIGNDQRQLGHSAWIRRAQAPYTIVLFPCSVTALCSDTHGDEKGLLILRDWMLLMFHILEGHRSVLLILRQYTEIWQFEARCELFYSIPFCRTYRLHRH